MIMQGRFRAGRWAICAALWVFSAAAAQAGGVVEGCDPRVMTAMQAVAEARVATAVAVNDAIYTMDDSVLALTCFNKAATVAAQQSGKIFSGDFTNVLAPVINDALTAMYTNFAEESNGGKAGAVDYSTGPGSAAQMPTSPETSFNCDQIASLWEAVSSSGIKDGLPPVSFDVLVGGSSALNVSLGDTADEKMKKSLSSSASKNAFDNAKAANDNLVKVRHPNFSGIKSPCEVLKTAKVIPDTAECNQ